MMLAAHGRTRGIGRVRFRLSRLGASAFCLALPACAIHYHDRHTGTDHLWGFGHVAIRLAPVEEGVRGVFREIESIGVSIGVARDNSYIAAGWHRLRRIDILAADAAVRIDRPAGGFFSIRVGTEFRAQRGAEDEAKERTR